MNFSITTDHQNKIIHYTHKALISKEDIGEAWQAFLGMKEFTEKKFDLLSDYSEAKFKMIVEDVSLIADFLLSLKDILKDKKQALITAEPLSTALSILFE